VTRPKLAGDFENFGFRRIQWQQPAKNWPF
jgi:hypothetical protein